MGAPELATVPDDIVYPEEERVGEELLQRWIVELLRPLTQRWLDECGRKALAGADQFIYYREGNIKERVAPDVYVLPGVAPGTRIRSWKIWETGIAPSFALEVASRDWRKDYEEAPGRYEEAGVDELVVFDPCWQERPGGAGVRWQVYRREGRAFGFIEKTNADRVRSESLSCWLRVVGEGDVQRLRLGHGPEGEILFPTAEEAERAAKEKERAAKEAALARIAELEAQLAELSHKDQQ